MGICTLTVNLVSVSKKHISADVVTICMLLHQYVIPTIACRSRVRLPFTNQCDSSVGRATDEHVGSSPTSAVGRIGGTGRRKALRMLVLTKYTASQKMVTNSKVGVACRQYIPMTLCCDAAMYYSIDLKERVPCAGKFWDYCNPVSTCRQCGDDADLAT